MRNANLFQSTIDITKMGQNTICIFITFSTESSVTTEGELVENAFGLCFYNWNSCLPNCLKFVQLSFGNLKIRVDGNTLLWHRYKNRVDGREIVIPTDRMVYLCNSIRSYKFQVTLLKVYFVYAVILICMICLLSVNKLFFLISRNFSLTIRILAMNFIQNKILFKSLLTSWWSEFLSNGRQHYTCWFWWWS